MGHGKIWAVAGLALLTTACASGPPHRGGGRFGGGFGGGFGDEGDGPPRPRIQLFVSPSGQPFRAPPGQPYPVAQWFAQADHDHDGKLTRAEFEADADAYFKVLDTNGDGSISMPEVTRWEEVLVPEISQVADMGVSSVGGRGAPSRNSLDTRRQGAAAFSLVNEPHPIRGADADFSMSVDKAEWRAAAERRFALLDVDGDGVVLLADLKPTPIQSRERAGKGRRAGEAGRGGGRREPR
jgi:Ca2+-binding EF-hand superfamily protein